MNTTVSTAQRLSELLDDAYMTADTLGKKIGVSGSIVSRWIRENSPIKLNNLLRLAEFFDCSVDFLCGRSENKDKFSTLKPTFPARFTELLKETGEGKESVIRKMGLANRTEYNWKQGIVPLSSTLIIVADYFDVTVDNLLGI